MASTLLFGFELEGVKARLRSWAIPGNPDTDQAWDERFSGPEGSIGFQTVPPGRTEVYISKASYRDFTYRTEMPHDAPVEIRLEKLPVHLERLTHINQHRFMTSTEQPLFLTGCTDFYLFYRHLQNRSLSEVFEQRQALGFNAVRVFGMMHYVPVNEFGEAPMKPQDWADYYDLLDDFFRLAESYGLYVYFSVFPDAGLIMPNLQDQINHWNKVVEVAADSNNVILELTNEIDAHDFNWVDATKFRKPGYPLSCSGSAGEGTHQNIWDFYDFHQRRDYPGHTKDANLADNPNTLAGHEGLLGEPDRYGSNGNSDAKKAFELAGSTKGTSLGVIFHSTDGKRSELFDDVTRNCAINFMKGL